MSDSVPFERHEHQEQRRSQPVRRRGEPFFDALVENRYSPLVVRRTLHLMLSEQYAEATRIHKLRGWGGAQPHGNDRYLYSLEQERRLTGLLPGTELLRPSQSLLYGIADAIIYPMHYGLSGDDCPTMARIDEASDIQARLARGTLHQQMSLFDPDPEQERTVVWLLFTGNVVAGGPLSAYLMLPGGRLPERRVSWPNIEPLLSESDSSGGPWPDLGDPKGPTGPLPTEPALNIHLKT